MVDDDGVAVNKKVGQDIVSLLVSLLPCFEVSTGMSVIQNCTIPGYDKNKLLSLAGIF